MKLVVYVFRTSILINAMINKLGLFFVTCFRPQQKWKPQEILHSQMCVHAALEYVDVVSSQCISSIVA